MEQKHEILTSLPAKTLVELVILSFTSTSSTQTVTTPPSRWTFWVLGALVCYTFAKQIKHPKPCPSVFSYKTLCKPTHYNPGPSLPSWGVATCPSTWGPGTWSGRESGPAGLSSHLVKIVQTGHFLDHFLKFSCFL